VDALDLLLSAGASLLFLAAVFVPLERAFPARAGQPFFRPAWGTDLAFFLGQYLLWNGLVLACLAPVGRALAALEPAGFRAGFASQPGWLLALEVVLLSDLLVYWAHRIQHRVPFLWRFHAVHHSAERLDWLAAHREHPLDSVWTLTWINLPVLALGFPVESVAGLVAFRGLWAIYIHSNVRIRLGPLRALVGSPELHHWHHARDRHAGNYANLSPLMDLLFGTYRCPDREPDALGLREAFPRGYVAQLLHPFKPRRRHAMPGSGAGAEAGTAYPASGLAAEPGQRSAA
jgi:sterol desaturase/sphingolipid hydroxylase (fatty acid hydroxylase superfamily)